MIYDIELSALLGVLTVILFQHTIDLEIKNISKW